jgi:acetyltransferase-like isoleucine patch superfamily enzyme
VIAESAPRRRIVRLPRRLTYVLAPQIASWLRKRWTLLRNGHANVRFDGPVYLGPGFSLHIPAGGTFEVGPGVEFRRGFRAELADGARVTIGAGSVFTNNVLIQCSTSIDIGKECMFGQSSSIFDGNHRFRDLDKPMLSQGYDFKPITIADGAVVTTKCTIVHDLGERCFVGANTMVNRPVPPYTVAVGVPVRIVDYFGPEGSEPPELARSGSDGEGTTAR